MTRDTIIHLASAVFTLAALAFVLFVTRYCICEVKQEEGRDEATDDFAEFYLDLHRYDPDAHFTREEAEALYSVWQRRQRVAKKEETNI